MTRGAKWVIASVGLGLALILGANAHFLYVAVSSAPGCAVETLIAGPDGEPRALQPAKRGC